MPFKNMAQSRACFAAKRQGTAGSWDCSEWAHATNYSKLPKGPKPKKRPREKQSAFATEFPILAAHLMVEAGGQPSVKRAVAAQESPGSCPHSSPWQQHDPKLLAALFGKQAALALADQTANSAPRNVAPGMPAPTLHGAAQPPNQTAAAGPALSNPQGPGFVHRGPLATLTNGHTGVHVAGVQHGNLQQNTA